MKTITSISLAVDRMFFGGKSWSSVGISHGSENFAFHCRATPRCTKFYNIGDAYISQCLHLASEKLVLASQSNLALATGLGSWNVNLEPWFFHINLHD